MISLRRPGDAEIALLVHRALVAGAEPAIGEGIAVGGRVVLVAAGDVGAADDDLADLAGRKQAAVRRHDRDLRAGGEADAARLARPRRQRVARHLVGGLGHAVGLDHRAVEGRLELRHDLRRQRGRRRADEAERCTRDRRPDCAERGRGSPDAWSAPPCTRSARHHRATGRTSAR